ncbi:MAG: hypothetical protein K0R54_775 [Clostridiaceae bacterium]|jgi:hypothetical protein|nr:hypothetical protein [Clostridiaceae bacterium]
MFKSLWVKVFVISTLIMLLRYFFINDNGYRGALLLEGFFEVLGGLIKYIFNRLLAG